MSNSTIPVALESNNRTILETTEATQEEWEHHNQIIIRGIDIVSDTLDEMSESLWWVYDTRAWVRGGYASFDAYYSAITTMSKSRVYQLINFAVIKRDIMESEEYQRWCTDVESDVHLVDVEGSVASNMDPTSVQLEERQCRPLKAIPKEIRGKLWVEAARMAGKLPSHAQIKVIVDEYLGVVPKVVVSKPKPPKSIETGQTKQTKQIVVTSGNQPPILGNDITPETHTTIDVIPAPEPQPSTAHNIDTVIDFTPPPTANQITGASTRHEKRQIRDVGTLDPEGPDIYEICDMMSNGSPTVPGSDTVPFFIDMPSLKIHLKSLRFNELQEFFRDIGAIYNEVKARRAELWARWENDSCDIEARDGLKELGEI